MGVQTGPSGVLDFFEMDDGWVEIGYQQQMVEPSYYGESDGTDEGKNFVTGPLDVAEGSSLAQNKAANDNKKKTSKRSKKHKKR